MDIKSKTKQMTLPGRTHGEASTTYTKTTALISLTTDRVPLEITADGVKTLLALLKAAPVGLAEVNAMVIPDAPEAGTEERAVWDEQYSGLARVAASGTKVVLRGVIDLEVWEPVT